MTTQPGDGGRPVDLATLRAAVRGPSSKMNRLDALGELIERSPRGLTKFLTEVALDSDIELDVRLSAVGALGDMEDDPNAVDGLVAALRAPDPPVVRRAAQRLGVVGDSENLAALPAVLINSQPTETGQIAFGIDNYGGARAMVEHLLAAGHRRIAFVAGPANNFDAYERLRGYRDALLAVDASAEPWVIPGDFGEASGHAAGLALLAAEQRPQAVFAANDMMALGCLFAFNQAGVRVPDEIALAGFDDIPLAHYMVPSLTTMRAVPAPETRGTPVIVNGPGCTSCENRWTPPA